jgi:anti-anti-sigma factor
VTHEVGVTVAWLDGVLVVDGDLDLATCPVLRRAINEHIESGARHVIVDFAQVKFCDSSCIACLVDPLRVGVGVTVRHPRENVLRTLKAAGVAELLDIEP